MMNVIPYEKSVALLADAFREILSVEKVAVKDAYGLISARDVFAVGSIPPFARSTVDGYALSYRDASAASPSVPSLLTLKGEVRMGEVNALSLESGECCYVPTGGMLPAGADSVLMIEDAEVLNDEVYVSRALRKGENVLDRGADVKEGDAVLRSGCRISSAVIGVLLSIGITTIDVFKPLTYYVVSTGDELVSPYDECPLGKIRDTNTSILVSELSKIGTVSGSALVRDDYPALQEAVRHALSCADVVILSGGSSVGKSDFTSDLFREFGSILFGGVAVKPGKPTLAACAKGKLLVGLPGHPMAAYASCRLILARALFKACGSDLPAPIVCRASKNFPGGKGRTAVIPVKLRNFPEYTGAEPLFYQSGMLSVISSADGFVLLPDHAEGVDKDAPVEVYLI